jgi:hypothetical protein
MSTNERDDGRRRIVAPKIGVATGTNAWRMLIPIWLGSAFIQSGLIGLFILIALFTQPANAGTTTKPDNIKVETLITDDKEPPQFNLTNPELGDKTNERINYNNDNINKDISAPGEVNRTEVPGILHGTDAIVRSIPLPAGTGGGTGAALDAGIAGFGQIQGTTGGMGGIYNPGGTGGRTAATREQMLEEGGGNKLSEAAVASGLAWLAAHQAPDGRWSLHNFPEHGRDATGQPVGKGGCGCTGKTNRRNDPAATGMALLPFLGAGFTHKPVSGSKQTDYSKTVLAGLTYLKGIQVKGDKDDGYLGADAKVNNMYGHAIATIALCEAYGMTNDPALKTAAQRAITFIVNAQSTEDPAKGGGGWRYAPKQAGDTSVTGWQVMALKSGQMAGLSVPAKTFTGVEEYLEKCRSSKGYGYSPGSGETPTMTAVGLLCREYLGVNPKNPDLLRGVEYLKQSPPGATGNLYYEYYATQVFHHLGGPTWQFWNLGPDGSGKNGIRDTLIRRQDTGMDAKLVHQKGSWPSQGKEGGGRDGSSEGGRIMWTSLSLLTLEVYYRHLPLYGRDLGTMKENTK